MNFNVSVLCFFAFVALASCQLHYSGGKLGVFRNRNRGPHHDGGSRFRNPHHGSQIHDPHRGSQIHDPHHKQPVVDPHHKQPVVHQPKGYAEVLNVNQERKHGYDGYKYFGDCNAHGDYPSKVITGIWDDKNNFNDLDAIKCDSLPDLTLDLEYIKYESFKPKPYAEDGTYELLCPPHYALTALYDQSFGFPSVKLGKCQQLQYGKLDYVNPESKYTHRKAGGPYGPYDHWKVQCPEHYVAVGLEKLGRQIKTLTCAYFDRPGKHGH